MKTEYSVVKRKCEFSGIYEILGEFEDYANAVMFREAYNKFYGAEAIIIDKWMKVHTNIKTS